MRQLSLLLNGLFSINFLDVTVIDDNGIIKKDLFTKPTDTHQVLGSCCKERVPYSQMLRLNRLCSEISFFDK